MDCHLFVGLPLQVECCMFCSLLFNLYRSVLCVLLYVGDHAAKAYAWTTRKYKVYTCITPQIYCFVMVYYSQTFIFIIVVIVDI